MSSGSDCGTYSSDFHEDFQDPIEAYFAHFPSFTYIPGPDWRQLRAFFDLSDHFGWDWRRKKLERALLTQAWTQRVETEFRETTLQHYQLLCQDLLVFPIPNTVGECKERLRRVYVNIVDLMQFRVDRVMGIPAVELPLFEGLKELTSYSKEEGKFYPLHDAKSEMLSVLLKKIGPRVKPGVQ